MKFIKSLIILLISLSLQTVICDFNFSYSINPTRPKVSVIVPIYNSEPWLVTCLDSIKNQTLKDIEIICVNDGSTDKSGEILDNYAKTDNRFIVIHQENKKIPGARNTGLERVTGEYITFVDSDDYLQPNAYEVAYNLAKKDDVDILQYNCNSFLDGHDKPIKNNNYSDSTVHCFDEYVVQNISYAIWNKLFKTDLIKQSNIKFVEGLVPADDTCFLFMLLSRANKIKFIQTKLYNYRIRRNSVSHQMPLNETFLNSYQMLKHICDYWRTNGYNMNKKHLLLTLLIKWCAPFNKELGYGYANEILDFIGTDIANVNTANKCHKFVQRELKKLKIAAQK